MRYTQVRDRVAQGLRSLLRAPGALKDGTLPLPRILQPGNLGRARHVWIVMPGLAALLLVYVFHGVSANSGIPVVAANSMPVPENTEYQVDSVLADPNLVPAVAPTPTPSSPYGVAGAAVLTASGIPAAALQAYQEAAAALASSDPSCGLHWSLLAGLGRVESNHGRFAGSSISASGTVVPPILGIRLDGSRPGTARISDTDGGRYDGDAVLDRAVGPMQFLPGTWKIYGAEGNPQDIRAAAAAAARYLCAGAGELKTQSGRWAAVYRYNHSDSYVSLVLSLADSYATGSPVAFPSRPRGTTTTDGEAATTPDRPPAVPEPSKPTTGTAPALVTTRPSTPATGSKPPVVTTAPSNSGPSDAPSAPATVAPPATAAPTASVTPPESSPTTSPATSPAAAGATEVSSEDPTTPADAG